MNQMPGDGSGPNGNSQRWWRRRSSWVAPARGVVDTGRYDIDRVDTAAAKRFVVEHHYSASFPASRFTYGLTDRHDGELVGVAVFGIPSSARVLTNAFPDLAPYDESLEPSRVVLLDGVAYNAESWFVAACHHDLVGRGVRGVVTFADPLPRYTLDGRLVVPGHAGIIYQALNMRLAGRTAAQTLMLLPDATVLHNRAAQKIRSRSRGHRYAEDLLIRLGAPPVDPGDPAGWLTAALQTVGARRVRHPGNLRYTLQLGRRRQPVRDAHRHRPAVQTALL